MIARIVVLLTALTSASAALCAPPQVRFTTNVGTFELTLDAERAPSTVQNFLEYVNSGFYDGTIFHRVISNFMIQGGGFDTGMDKKDTRDPIQNEAHNGLKNDRGTIAMARTGAPHSATAQFFINVVDNDSLNFTRKSGRGWGYAVFGKVTAGMAVVDQIRDVDVGSQGYFQNLPTQSIIIEKAELLEPKGD